MNLQKYLVIVKKLKELALINVMRMGPYSQPFVFFLAYKWAQ